MQGLTWHWTASTGFSIAEASNVWIDGLDVSILAAEKLYNQLIAKARKELQEMGEAANEDDRKALAYIVKNAKASMDGLRECKANE